MPRVRLTLSLGRPDPDRLSTALAWSLAGHVGLGVGVLVYQALPSQAPAHGDAFFVRLAAPAGAPGPAAAGPPQAASAPKAHATEPAEPAAPKAHPAPVSAPAKVVPAEKSKPKYVPSTHDTIPVPKAAQNPAPHDEDTHSGEGEATAKTEHAGHGGDGGDGTEGTGAGAGGGGGVGGTEFGEGDFQYGWYQAAIERKLRSMWKPPVADAPQIQTATVSFTIMKNGAVQAISISTPSGNAALDRSVLSAVYSASPLPALPPGWDGNSVHVSMEFRLNPEE
jgi:TonB family protein